MFTYLVLFTYIVLALCTSNDESHYDYVIVGGGTAGLVVANRLSENPAVTVAVIEAGGSVFENANVTNTTTFGLGMNTAIDWQYPSEPQDYSFNRTFVYSAGKALGGTSTINDAFETLGNAGWNWASLWPYYKKSELFQIPDAERQSLGASYDPNFHGFKGPVTVGWSTTLMSGNVHELLNSSWQNVGIPYIPDLNGGDLRGFSMWPFTLNNSVGGEGIRQDAARAYYYPFASARPNLHIYLNTTANKLIWMEGTEKEEDGLSAGGVEVQSAAGEVYNILADSEVILSAGSLRSPLLLEHSGVGNPAILEKYSIPVRVALPSVGENLQDQPNTAMSFSFNYNASGYSAYVTNLDAKDLFGTALADVESSVRDSIPSYASQVSTNSGNALDTSALEQFFSLQADIIFQQLSPLAEVLNVPISGAPQLLFPFWNLFPFARGSVHTQSADPAAPPAINPNFFQFPIDINITAAIGRSIRRAVSTAPLADLVTAELAPNTTVVPLDASDEVWGEWVKQAFGLNHHPVGTVAMMSRELGGVVDEQLKVYGTRNVRVVDGSVLPFQVAGHLTSTIYAVAERAADIIRGAGLLEG